MRRILLLVLTLGLVTGLAAPATAKPIEQGTWEFQFSGTSEEEEAEWLEKDCGITDVHWEADVRGRWLRNTARGEFGSGFAYEMQWVKGTHTFTSLETGKTFTLHFNLLSKDQKVIDNSDGTITIIAAFPGRHFVYGPDGNLLFRDAGTTWWEIVFDLEADEAVSERMLRSAGHRDTIDHDFCDDLREYILP